MTLARRLCRAQTALAIAAALLAACGGGSTPVDPATPTLAQECSGSCAGAASFLSVSDVQRVLAQAVAEAQARNARATIAVVDRVGNVLAVYRMAGAANSMTITSTQASAGGRAVTGGLEGVNIVPASLGAIAKAITGAYLSSEGNAFSTRTASQIVQEHFNPGEVLAPGGPLLGVQFSQLPCSDLAARASGAAPAPGPHRSPLGLAADPGGFPLYKDGTPVGGVGVLADGFYAYDANVQDRDRDLDEQIAFAAASGFAAPEDRRADRITADGKTLRFSDVESADLVSVPANAPAFGTLTASIGTLIAIPGYTDGTSHAGLAFTTVASGIRADTLDYSGLDAFVLVDASNSERYRPRAGTEASGALSVAESQAVVRSALRVANHARAQIRRPLGTPARVSVALVDSTGVILGIARSRDAPVFGVDVSLQKARSAAFFSGASAAAALNALPDAVFLNGGLSVRSRQAPGAYVSQLRSFLALPAALADGQVAFTARALGNLARPFYPDGVDGNPAAPLSRNFSSWSPFSTGLQLDLVHNAIIQHVAFVLGAAPDVPANCSGVGGFDTAFANSGAIAAVANGMQIFPGSVPIYRGRQLVGALGVSGDGVDQDDMVALLGVDESGVAGIGNAPPDLRADRLLPQGSRLRYVGCPAAPYLDSNASGVCDGR
jgi:uncharacterized protein GlcG (DUF336 family)